MKKEKDAFKRAARQITIFCATLMLFIGLPLVYTELKWSGCYKCILRSYEKDKYTDISAPLFISYSKELDRYAVSLRNSDGSRDEFLWHVYGNYDFSLIAFDTFKDSVDAKSFALQYLEDERHSELLKTSFKSPFKSQESNPVKNQQQFEADEKRTEPPREKLISARTKVTSKSAENIVDTFFNSKIIYKNKFENETFNSATYTVRINGFQLQMFEDFYVPYEQKENIEFSLRKENGKLIMIDDLSQTKLNKLEHWIKEQF